MFNVYSVMLFDQLNIEIFKIIKTTFNLLARFYALILQFVFYRLYFTDCILQIAFY